MGIVDSILIQNGRAHQIWRNATIAMAPPMTADLMAQIVEFPAGTVNEGDLWDGANFVAPAAPVPASISRRQFYEQLARADLISTAEALAAVKVGAIPAALQLIVDALPDAGDRFALEMLLAGAAAFERNHPFVATIAAARGMSSAEVDAFFRAAALF